MIVKIIRCWRMLFDDGENGLLEEADTTLLGFYFKRLLMLMRNFVTIFYSQCHDIYSTCNYRSLRALVIRDNQNDPPRVQTPIVHTHFDSHQHQTSNP